MRILVTGATGLIGTHLTQLLKSKGYQIAILTRSLKEENDFDTYLWDPSSGTIDKNAFNGVDCIIHLAGANIADRRWSESRKEEIINSRTQSTKLLEEQIKKNGLKLKAFISASAIGYYGSKTTRKIHIETDPPDSGFLGESCSLWELSSNEIQELGIRIVHLRTGIVLTKRGGALEQLARPISFGLGAAIGTGNQYMPWIHIEDICQMYIEAIENTSLRGAYNAVSPGHTTNDSFTKSIADVLRKIIWLPNIPRFVIKILLGEMSSIIIGGSRVSSQKIISSGFTFKFKKLDQALSDLLN